MRRVVPATGWRIVAALLIGALVATAYLRDLGRNPYGFFCDEALIGVQARQVLDGTRPEGTLSLFYDHFGTVAGSLPVYATVPFVWLFGLSEFSVRFASVVYLLLTCAVLLAHFRRLGPGAPWLPVLVFALSPIVIHLSRVNFGHTPALFLISLGYVLYLVGRDRPRPWLVTVAGIVTGLSAYGYPGFYVATPLFLIIVIVSELAYLRSRPGRRRALLALAAFASGALATLVPIVQRALSDPAFSNRFEAKDAAGYGLVSLARLETMVENYPKYLGVDFLFRTGDRGLPGAFIQRHTVDGAGLLGPVALPLLVLGLLAFLISWRCDRARPFAPFMLLAFLLPLPDLITTAADQPPYSFAMFTGVLAVPFLAAYGLETLRRGHAALTGSTSGSGNEGADGRSQPPSGGHPWRSILALVTSSRFIAVLVFITGFFFVFSTYARYPDVSSGFWGWQAGPREMIGYYVEHREEYDAFVMEGAFNEPAIFLDFYIDDPELRATASIGGPDALDPAPRQLFGVSRETFEALDRDRWTVRHSVLYPNGEVAFYLVELDRTQAP